MKVCYKNRTVINSELFIVFIPRFPCSPDSLVSCHSPTTWRWIRDSQWMCASLTFTWWLLGCAGCDTEVKEVLPHLFQSSHFSFSPFKSLTPIFPLVPNFGEPLCVCSYSTKERLKHISAPPTQEMRLLSRFLFLVFFPPLCFLIAAWTTESIWFSSSAGLDALAFWNH